MACSIESSRAPLSFARLAALALVAAGATGCSPDVSRFNDNPFSSHVWRANPEVTGSVRSPSPVPEVTGSVQSPAPVPVAPVGRADAQPLPTGHAVYQ